MGVDGMSQAVEELTKKNLAIAFKRLKKDTKGFKTLIVRDPLDYIDFIVNLDENLDSIVYEIKNNLYHPQKPFLLLSAKSKGINRPTVVFDIKDALMYRFCIEQIEDEIIKKTRQKQSRSFKNPEGFSPLSLFCSECSGYRSSLS